MRKELKLQFVVKVLFVVFNLDFISWYTRCDTLRLKFRNDGTRTCFQSTDVIEWIEGWRNNQRRSRKNLEIIILTSGYGGCFVGLLERFKSS